MTEHTQNEPSLVATEQPKGKPAKRVMSGMRPTGRLHLGHYLGVLKNWVSLQEQYECYFMVADWHALTTKYDQTESLQDNIIEMVLDWLAVGIDPTKANFYVQSHISEIAELHLLLSMLTPLPWVQGDPTLKDMVKMLSDDLNYGLLGYPVLQTADVLTVLGELIPVGKDQEAHLEISRDLARRFNHMYKTDLFPEPRPLFTETPTLIGLDGSKMGKSANNGIFISDTADETAKKIKKKAVTDTKRVQRDDPGEPEDCAAVYQWYKAFAPKEVTELTANECRSAARGCGDCKKILTDIINTEMQPIRERRALYAADKGQVITLLNQGAELTRGEARRVLKSVKSVMNLL